ncbi:MAG: L-histidine N(alpha)-methyltransferase [Planctomycetaceae bacterium]|nr:L-histidine N(alpha)-methyltransferase [Planctomycetaceae bacterium]
MNPASSTSTLTESDFLADVWKGLSRPQKTLPCKYFYDVRGSELFDQICELDEYYPTRTELEIMESCVDRMAEKIGPHSTLIEFGSGSSLKTRLLLDSLTPPLTYAPIDISGDYLLDVADSLRSLYPQFEIVPIVADFTQPIDTFQLAESPSRRVVYFPGSTLGNFPQEEAGRLLKQMADLVGPEGSLLIGIDLEKEIDVLKAAYNDSAGVTAEFNLNLLTRINRELEGDFDLDQFRHEAIWNEKHSRIEMHLVSDCEQTVTIAEREFEFATGESIHTENSHKYSLDRFSALAEAAGFRIETSWTDERDWFAVLHCRVR